MVCSDVNETNELSGLSSMFLDLTFTTISDNLTPVLDIDRMSVITTANILDKIESSGDIYPTTDYIPSTHPHGDNNSAIYITKKVALENPATALKVLFDANRPASTEIKVLHKILPAASSDDFDDLGYVFFSQTAFLPVRTNLALFSLIFRKIEYRMSLWSCQQSPNLFYCHEDAKFFILYIH